MDICYYITQIREETDGACEYLKRATSCKSEHPDWAATYAKMADMEMDHAANLVKIFEDDYKKSKTDDPIYPQIRDQILAMYADSVSHIKALQQVYASK